MKILRKRNDAGTYSAMIREYCCDNLRLSRGIFTFLPDGRYGVGCGAEAKFCPFCGEKIEIEKE